MGPCLRSLFLWANCLFLWRYKPSLPYGNGKYATCPGRDAKILRVPDLFGRIWSELGKNELLSAFVHPGNEIKAYERKRVLPPSPSLLASLLLPWPPSPLPPLFPLPLPRALMFALVSPSRGRHSQRVCALPISATLFSMRR